MSDLLAQPFTVKPRLISLELQHEIEQYYAWEAKLLNDRRFEEWFALLASDIHYFMPIRTTRVMRNVDEEYSKPREYAHFDDDLEMMTGRLRKITSDFSWSENPASRTRHVVSNVMVEERDEPGEYDVSSVFIVYRNRLERQVDIFAGERRDLLRRAETSVGFELAGPTVLIDQSTVLSNNLSFFF